MRILLSVIQKVAFESLGVLRIWLNDMALLKFAILILNMTTRRGSFVFITSEFTIPDSIGGSIARGPRQSQHAGPLSPRPPKPRPRSIWGPEKRKKMGPGSGPARKWHRSNGRVWFEVSVRLGYGPVCEGERKGSGVPGGETS